MNDKSAFVDRKGKIFNIITCFSGVYGIAVYDIKSGRRISIIPDSLSHSAAEVSQKFANYAKLNRWLALSKDQYTQIKKLWHLQRRVRLRKNKI